MFMKLGTFITPLKVILITFLQTPIMNINNVNVVWTYEVEATLAPLNV